jgi:glucose-1-phosphate thymidylyltransferase
MEIAKALVLAGGRSDGSPWPVAPGSRHLFPIANRPILFHNLEALRAAGVLEVLIVAEPDTAAAIERAVGDGSEHGLSVRISEWPAAVGLGDVLASADDFLAGEPVLVEHGDALLTERMHAHIAMFAREDLDALALRLPATAGSSIAALTPGYLLSPRAISILRAGLPGTEPLAGVRAGGGRVGVQQVRGCLPCGGAVDALLESNRCMLEGISAQIDPQSLQESTVHGAVQVHPSAHVRRSLLRGPLVIGPNAHVTDAYIGPYTSIGAGVTVEGAEIEHSIVLPEAELRFVGTRVESSLIGRRARIVRGFDLPAAIRVSLGDDAEVVLR